MKKSMTFFFVLFSFLQLSAQHSNKSAAIPLAKLDSLHSEIVNEDYRLHITLPFGYAAEGKKYPVFYYLDAWAMSGTVNELGLLAMASNSIDPIIFVGISYETNGSTIGKLRRRDLFPPVNELDTISGGDKFLQFIKMELVPYIENKYAANPDDRGLIGGSLAGLFCTWALKKEPDLFHRLGIISPSLWYGNGFLLNDAALLENIKQATELKVYLAVGSLEPESMIANTNQLFELIKANENIQSKKVTFQDERHGEVFLAALSRGVRYLYPNEYRLLIGQGNDFYDNKEFNKAKESYELAFNHSPIQISETDRYNIACFYALSGDTENAFKYLQIIANSNYDNYDHITTDPDLNSLHQDKRWADLIITVKQNKAVNQKD